MSSRIVPAPPSPLLRKVLDTGPFRPAIHIATALQFLLIVVCSVRPGVLPPAAILTVTVALLGTAFVSAVLAVLQRLRRAKEAV